MDQIDFDGFDVIILNTFAFSQKRNIGKGNRQTLVRLGQFRKLTCDEFGDL